MTNIKTSGWGGNVEYGLDSLCQSQELVRMLLLWEYLTLASLSLQWRSSFPIYAIEK